MKSVGQLILYTGAVDVNIPSGMLSINLNLHFPIFYSTPQKKEEGVFSALYKSMEKACRFVFLDLGEIQEKTYTHNS